MSVITNVRYSTSNHSVIKADFNGKPTCVPATVGNRHYDEIVKKGIPIADYEAPVKPPEQLLKEHPMSDEIEYIIESMDAGQLGRLNADLTNSYTAKKVLRAAV